MLWKNEKTKYDFKDIYPKSFYQKSYFAQTAIVAAIAGGSAGSYLADVAAVGSWFGGGMVLCLEQWQELRQNWRI